MSVTVRPFGTTREGTPVSCFRLENGVGAWVEILSYGGTIRALSVPDGAGVAADVCLGYETLAEYEDQDGCLGALVGRCANRIAEGRFTLGGKEYALAVNNGPNHLHGGLRGFDRRVWDAQCQGETLVLTDTSPDGDEGYPGTVWAEARYTWTGQNELVLDLRAETDAETLVNLTNHAYWNLDGQEAGSVGDHTLQVCSESITENDVHSCPNGRMYPVKGTPLDLRSPRRLADGWDGADPQIAIGCGYDHNYALSLGAVRPVATLRGRGRTLTLSTDQPGLQIYTANWLTPRPGKGGAVYDRRCGVALEAQGWPNAVNLPGFPSVVLQPGETYCRKIIFAFS